MSDSQSKNLSETLFKKHRQAKETSQLTRYLPSSLELLKEKREREGYSWYRNLRRYHWIWLGMDPIEQERVLAKIASSPNSRSEEQWLDTVMGYHSGNWTYEWIALGMEHQKKAADMEGDAAADEYAYASLCFGLAGYPHLKGDSLALQAQALASTAYDEVGKHSRYVIKQVEVPFEGKKIRAYLHLPHTKEPLPVVVVGAGLDSLHSDLWKLFRDYLAPGNIAMLILDMPSVGHSSQFTLTENSCSLHRAVLEKLPELPWVDHHRVGLLGYRFGGNAMVRLAFMQPDKIKACVSIGAPIHHFFSTADKVKGASKMYLDVLVSRLGKASVDLNSFAGQMQAWSLKSQGFFSGRKTKVPILAVALEGDPISPYSDNRLVAMFSDGGKAKQISARSISVGYEQTLDLAIKWLKDELN
ncbi:esterase FrsA [Vibrio sp. HA2012]|uniref:esterase FrsA n=1 Tax=Vibrio sp. HA2012 TaxID=1971595 RepID=UPI000C2B92C2|nr:esterase FrsA [Vibrio sp. HA2012]PJC86495.1 esterase FrsA [Vibrio sp. HA2012]